MAVVAYLSYRGLFELFGSVLLAVTVAIILSVLVYFVLMIVTKTLNKKELYDLPMGGRIVRLAKSVHLLKE